MTVHSSAHYKKFNEIYHDYKSWVTVCAGKLVNDSEGRQDLEQSVWITVWKYLDNIDITYKTLTPILAKITHRVFLTQIKKKRVLCNPLDVTLNIGEWDPIFPRLDFDHLLDIINNKIKKQHRNVARLKWIYQYKTKDIAEELSLPFGRVKSILVMAKNEIVLYYNSDNNHKG